jgi:hypothetical protein
MKVKQIVSEHKKGVRAMKYGKKTKGTVPVYGPESKDAKLKPVKPVGTVQEDATNVQIKPIANAQQIDINGQKVATTTDAGAAATIAQLAKDGKIAMNPPSNSTNPTSMEEEQPGSDPQMSALQKLLSTAQQPWEQEQIKWRMERLQSQQDLAGEPGAGMGAPVDANGNLIPVLPPKEWMAKNPNIVKQLPNKALPPEMQRPGMIDRLKGLAGIK